MISLYYACSACGKQLGEFKSPQKEEAHRQTLAQSIHPLSCKECPSLCERDFYVCRQEDPTPPSFMIGQVQRLILALIQDHQSPLEAKRARIKNLEREYKEFYDLLHQCDNERLHIQGSGAEYLEKLKENTDRSALLQAQAHQAATKLELAQTSLFLSPHHYYYQVSIVQSEVDLLCRPIEEVLKSPSTYSAMDEATQASLSVLKRTYFISNEVSLGRLCSQHLQEFLKTDSKGKTVTKTLLYYQAQIKEMKTKWQDPKLLIHWVNTFGKVVKNQRYPSFVQELNTQVKEALEQKQKVWEATLYLARKERFDHLKDTLGKQVQDFVDKEEKLILKACLLTGFSQLCSRRYVLILQQREQLALMTHIVRQRIDAFLFSVQEFVVKQLRSTCDEIENHFLALQKKEALASFLIHTPQNAFPVEITYSSTPDQQSRFYTYLSTGKQTVQSSAIVARRRLAGQLDSSLFSIS